MVELEFQLLWHAVAIRTESLDVVEALAFLAQQARQSVTVEATMRFDVQTTSRGHAIREERDIVDVVDSAHDVLDVLYRRVHDRAYAHASSQGWVRLHAGLATINGRRILAVGESGAGKTTLMLRLLFDGARVDGDEFVLLRGGAAIAYPRPLHLKHGMEAVIPELASIITRAPRLPQDPPIWAFDPTEFGWPWEIDEGGVDAVVVVERAHGAASSIEAVSATGVMQQVVEQVYPLHETKSVIIREVAAILQIAPCFRLRIGDVTEASRLLHQLEG